MRDRIRALANASPEERVRIIHSMSPIEVLRLDAWFEAWAHKGQLPPDGDGWRVWLMMAGRGFGKTRAGAEWIHALATGKRGVRIALVGATIHEARGVMVEGVSGLLQVAKLNGERLRWEPSLGKLTWRNGSEAQIFSGENPDGLRGPEYDFAWADELAKWGRPEEAWANLQMGLRRGPRARALITTTPRTMSLLTQISEDPWTVQTTGRTDENINLDQRFIDVMTATYGGTRLGRQELDGVLIADIEGSLWPRDLIERSRAERPERFERIVVGVDPPAGVGEGCDACGIVVAGRAEGKLYVLADETCQGLSPDGWSRRVAAAVARWDADMVVAEANNGGAMVGSVLEAAEVGVRVKLVHASAGKSVRAEPIALRFENGRAVLAGVFAELEDEMSAMTVGGRYERAGRSPDRADAMVWAIGPGPRRGPRLNDLSIQTSSYGTQIPRIYGRMRVAGSVVWATELKESSEPAGGAKGQPEVIVYSYSASFAVALSSRAAHGIGRIWADGKLLRGEAGDFKVKTGFRFYPGTEDQEIDPLIASVEGIDRTTAFRGLAIAVFEDLQLAEYGNRLPFLTFEVIGDESDPSIGDILADASAGHIESDVAEAVLGYAAYGANRRGSVQPIVDQFAVPVFDDGKRIRAASAILRRPSEDVLGCAADQIDQPRSERTRKGSRAMLNSLALTYYDADRDYQSGQMQATAAARGGVDETVELPIVLQATHAKALAEGHIARRWGERDRLVLWLSPDFISVEPGSLIATRDGVTWRVREATIDGLAVRLDLLRVAERVASVPADAGAHLPAPDVVASPTSFGVLDLPDLGTGRHDVPVLHIAACQPVAGWRQVPFEINVGGEVRTIASAPSEAIVGAALDVLAAGPLVGVDESNSIEVQLSDREHWLESRDDGAMAQGANLAAIGRELVQFGRAVALGEGRFRLEHLLRGRRGTEYAVDGHGPGEPFVLISSGGLREIALPPSAIGASVSIRPMGLADDGAEPIVCQVTGENMRPPAPVDLQAQPIAEGGLLLQWTRRSRAGWDWPSGSEPPLGESSERYRVTLDWTGGSLDLTATEPRLEIAADTLGNVSGDLTITVVQIGDFAESRSASISITI